MDKKVLKQMKIKDLHHKYCDKCLNFQVRACMGIMYHVPNIAEQPLCNKVKNKLKELENENI